MKLEDIILENKKSKANLFSGLSDMLAFDISLGLNNDEFSIDYMHEYIEKEQVKDQSGVLYSAKEVTRNKRLAALLVSLSLIAFTVVYGPSVFYASAGYLGYDNTTENILETAKASELEIKGNNTPVEKKYEPPYDPSLPDTHMLSIPSAGIETEIHEAVYENHEDALRKGVWRVSWSGSPAEQEEPIILAAHRYGYLKWSIPYRLKNSFYNLPKAELGDEIEIVWRQRKYVYEIYAEVEGEGITDNSADLILYTCKDLKSPVRIFKYARLVRDDKSV